MADALVVFNQQFAADLFGLYLKTNRYRAIINVIDSTGIPILVGAVR